MGDREPIDVGHAKIGHISKRRFHERHLGAVHVDDTINLPHHICGTAVICEAHLRHELLVAGDDIAGNVPLVLNCHDIIRRHGAEYWNFSLVPDKRIGGNASPRWIGNGVCHSLIHIIATARD